MEGRKLCLLGLLTLIHTGIAVQDRIDHQYFAACFSYLNLDNLAIEETDLDRRCGDRCFVMKRGWGNAVIPDGFSNKYCRDVWMGEGPPRVPDLATPTPAPSKFVPVTNKPQYSVPAPAPDRPDYSDYSDRHSPPKKNPFLFVAQSKKKSVQPKYQNLPPLMGITNADLEEWTVDLVRNLFPAGDDGGQGGGTVSFDQEAVYSFFNYGVKAVRDKVSAECKKECGEAEEWARKEALKECPGCPSPRTSAKDHVIPCKVCCDDRGPCPSCASYKQDNRTCHEEKTTLEDAKKLCQTQLANCDRDHTKAVSDCRIDKNNIRTANKKARAEIKSSKDGDLTECRTERDEALADVERLTKEAAANISALAAEADADVSALNKSKRVLQTKLDKLQAKLDACLTANATGNSLLTTARNDLSDCRWESKGHQGDARLANLTAIQEKSFHQDCTRRHAFTEKSYLDCKTDLKTCRRDASTEKTDNDNMLRTCHAREESSRIAAHNATAECEVKVSQVRDRFEDEMLVRLNETVRAETCAAKLRDNEENLETTKAELDLTQQQWKACSDGAALTQKDFLRVSRELGERHAAPCNCSRVQMLLDELRDTPLPGRPATARLRSGTDKLCGDVVHSLGMDDAIKDNTVIACFVVIAILVAALIATWSLYIVNAWRQIGPFGHKCPFNPAQHGAALDALALQERERNEAAPAAAAAAPAAAAGGQ